MLAQVNYAKSEHCVSMHPEETSKNSDIYDLLKVSDIEKEW